MKKIIFSSLFPLLILVNVAAFGQQQTQHAYTLRQILGSRDTIMMNQTFASEVMPQLQKVDTTKFDPSVVLKPKSYTMGQMIRDSVLAAQYRLGGVTLTDFANIFHNFRYGSLGDIQLSPYGNIMFLQCGAGNQAVEYIINLMWSPQYRHWALEAYRYPMQGVKVVFAKGTQVLSSM